MKRKVASFSSLSTTMLDTSLFSPRERRNFSILIGILIFIIVFALLYWIIPLLSLFSRPSPPQAPPQVRHEQNIVPPAQIFNWVGEITKIEKNVITIVAAQPPLQGSKKVTVTPATAITKLTFSPVITNGQKRFTPQETTLKFESLKIGWYIEVLAPTDISQQDEFTAIHIRVLP